MLVTFILCKQRVGNLEKRILKFNDAPGKSGF